MRLTVWPVVKDNWRMLSLYCNSYLLVVCVLWNYLRHQNRPLLSLYKCTTKFVSVQPIQGRRVPEFAAIRGFALAVFYKHLKYFNSNSMQKIPAKM